MNKIIVLSNGININNVIFPNNSLSFTYLGIYIGISLVASKKQLFTAPYYDFCNASGVVYTSVQDVIGDLIQNNKQSSGGGGSGDFKADGSVPMTGQLQLAGDPEGNLNPVTKQLYDATNTIINGRIDDEENSRESADLLKEDKTNKGQANGYAPLNSSSLIDSTYLPSYVDDILEFSNLAAFPVTGETGKIYIALDTDREYRWTGSVYRAITNGFIASTADVPDSTNKRYVTDSQLTVLGNTSGTNTGDETAARISTINHAANNKTSLVDADEITGQDSAASFGLIRTTWTNVKAFLKTYFDTLYQATGLAALKANNLSDLASASTARTNLGLGDSATKNTGTSAGTVATGDDSRFSDVRNRKIIGYSNIDSTFTGSTAETRLCNILIPAGSVDINGTINIEAVLMSTGASGSKNYKMYLSTVSNSFTTGAVNIALNTVGATAFQTACFMRKIVMKGTISTNTMVNATQSAMTDLGGINLARQVLNRDFSVDQYLIITGTLTTSSDSVGLDSCHIYINKP